jgi:biotin operon repressor
VRACLAAGRLRAECPGRPPARPGARLYTRRVLFEKRLRDGIHSGRITLAFRRWRRSQVVAGHRYRTGLDLVEAAAVDIVTAGDIDAGQAHAAGYATVEDLLAGLRGSPALPLYRVRFRLLAEPDPRDVLAASSSLTEDEIVEVAARLARMDKASKRGPWTAAVLDQIAGRPGVSSAPIAEDMGWVRADLKLHVRRLKELGLTISLEVGYRLSPRGAAYLAAARANAPRPGA